MVTCQGASGIEYNYTAYEIGGPLPVASGNYIFAKPGQGNLWVAIYAGETGNFGDRIPNHNELPCVRFNGGTHVLIHQHNGGPQARRAEERDIIENYDPPCNG